MRIPIWFRRLCWWLSAIFQVEYRIRIEKVLGHWTEVEVPAYPVRRKRHERH